MVEVSMVMIRRGRALVKQSELLVIVPGHAALLWAEVVRAIFTKEWGLIQRRDWQKEGLRLKVNLLLIVNRRHCTHPGDCNCVLGKTASSSVGMQ